MMPLSSNIFVILLAVVGFSLSAPSTCRVLGVALLDDAKIDSCTC